MLGVFCDSEATSSFLPWEKQSADPRLARFIMVIFPFVERSQKSAFIAIAMPRLIRHGWNISNNNNNNNVQWFISCPDIDDVPLCATITSTPGCSVKQFTVSIIMEEERRKKKKRLVCGKRNLFRQIYVIFYFCTLHEPDWCNLQHHLHRSCTFRRRGVQRATRGKRHRGIALHCINCINGLVLFLPSVCACKHAN